MKNDREKSRFLKVGCPRCGTQQVIFGKSSISIKCVKCNYLLLKTQGGKAKMRGPVKRILC